MQPRPWQWILGIAACLALIGIVGTAFWNAMQPPADEVVQGKKDEEPREPENKSTPNPDLAANGKAETPANDPANPNPQPAVEPLTPAPTAPTAQAVEIVIPAERFIRGNVLIDNKEFGGPQTVVIHSEKEDRRNVEYLIEVPQEGSYHLHLRYASEESRPLRVTLNGKRQEQVVARRTSGGYRASQQQWFSEGQLPFRQGRNTLRLERDGRFPHLNALVVSNSATVSESVLAKAGPGEVAGAADPWSAPLQTDPVSFAAASFTNFNTDVALPQPSDLLRWLETIPNHPRRINETRTKLGRCAEIDGVFRMRLPWEDGVALRLSLENHNRLRMHFYHGLQGVTLAYYQDEGSTWCGYSTTRANPQTPLPNSLVMTATDDGRCQRSEYRFGGPIEIVWHAGELILSRGDTILLRAPMPEVPQDVYFDGRAAFHGIEAARRSELPPPVAQRPVLRDITKPAELTWREKLSEGAKVVKHDNGALELVADNAKEYGYILIPLDVPELSEVVVELEGITPGAGVFLAGEQRPNHGTIRFGKNHRTNPPSLGAQVRHDEHREGDFGDYRERPSMHVSSGKQYVRLIGGAGMVRFALSSDGVHWGGWEAQESNLPPGISHLLLDYTRHTANCRIKLNRITVRKLPALMAQADPALLGKAPLSKSGSTPTINQWIAAVTNAQPAGVDSSTWRRTCALRALAAGCNTELGQTLVHMVLDDAETRKLPPQELFDLYNEAFLLIETRHNGALAQECWKRYFRLAQRAYREQGLRPFSLVRKAAMDSPVGWRHNLTMADDKSIKLELVDLLYRGQWDEVLAFCHMLRFYQLHQRVPLVDWAESTALRQLPGRPNVETTLSRQKLAWRPLLVEDLSKEVYNALAELQAVLESDAFEDAARLITSLSPEAVIGVAPYGQDRQLLVSMPTAIRLAVRSYPALQATMNQKFGPLAQLRIQQSMNANNVAAVELAAVQFEATESASDAHRWLGDRSLSSGLFSRAMAEYRRALRNAPSARQHDLQARLRLAAAMQGEEYGEPITREVALGEMNVSAAEFESIVAEMRQANAGQNSGSAAVAPTRVWPAPVPTGFEMVQRGRLDGPIGTSPQEEVVREMNNQRIAWCERQLATAVDNNVLYVSNRFQVAAYDLSNGQRQWQTTKPPGNELRARDWPLMPMQPLLTGKHIFVRLLYGSGPTLACFERSTGRMLWTSEQRSDEFIVSDPLLVQDQLVALTLVRGDRDRGEQGQSALRLTIYDRESGEQIADRPLLRVNEGWWQRRAGEVIALDDRVIAALGGVIVCADLRGEVHWIRKQISMPAEEDASWQRQYFERPLLINGRLYVTQPGVRSLECLDPETGKLHWSRVIPDLESLVGAVDDQLIVRTESDFVALQASDGQPRWRHNRPEVFDAVMLGAPGGLLYVQRQNAKDRQDRSYPQMVWVDLQTGRATNTFPLSQLENNEPHLGPLVRHGDRLWTFSANGHIEANRDLIELVPKAELPLVPYAATSTRSPWNSGLETALRSASERFATTFTLLAGGTNGESGERAEAFGEHNVLGVCVRSGQPLVFVQELAAGEPARKLKLRFAYRGDNLKAQVSARFAGETIWTQKIEGNSPAQQQWQDWEVDLARLAGKSGPLQLRVEIVEGGEMSTYWKRLELTP